MKKILATLLLIVPLTAICQQPLKLWYTQPALKWTQALPLGNGRLGAMIFGNPADELIQLNESTLWSGGPTPASVNPDAYPYLAQIREAVSAGDYKKAAQLSQKMQGHYSEAYMPLADLKLKQSFKGDGKVSNYYRDLNISDAVATTRFTANGVTYTRQMFTSAPDQVIVIRLTANKPGQLNLKVAATSQLRYKTSVAANNSLMINGRAPAHADPSYLNRKDPVHYNEDECKGMRYALLTKAIHKGGTLSADTTGITIKNANQL